MPAKVSCRIFKNSENGQKEFGSEVSAVVKEHPLATIAIAAGLAFAVGALRKIGGPSPKSHLATLRSQLPDLPSPKQLRAYWR